MQSEEQWIEVGKCEDCHSPVYKMDDEIKFTGPAECGCWLRKEEDGREKIRNIQNMGSVESDRSRLLKLNRL